MEGSKIHLSAAEWQLVRDPGVILTKNTIIQKTVALFGELMAAITEEGAPLAAEIRLIPPKISRGENYQGLPYVVLDYPRVSENGDLCFIRTLFWWGHFFSSTLQVSGKYREALLPRILSARDLLAGKDYFLGVSNDPWHHHFEEGNYRRIASLDPEQFERLLGQQPHTKIAARWPLEQWPDAAGYLLESWKFLAGLIS
ncbi:MAG: hypothetical protein ACXVMS_13175 [Flavisolibacter sp.]